MPLDWSPYVPGGPVAAAGAPPNGTVARLPVGAAELRLMRWVPPDPAATVLIAQGRTEFIEKYFPTVAQLLARGFAVYAFDWRGQGLSVRALGNRRKGHVGDFADYMADLAAVVAAVDWHEGPRLLLAHSMGGHVALRQLATGWCGIDAAVLSAPMVDLSFAPLPRSAIQALCRALPPTWYAPGRGNATPGKGDFPGNLLTGDRAQFDTMIDLVTENEDLAIGGPTVGWLAAALASIDVLWAPGTAERVDLPTLIVCGGREQVVPIPRLRAFTDRMPNARFAVEPSTRHEILIEREGARACFWQWFDDFVTDLHAR